MLSCNVHRNLLIFRSGLVSLIIYFFCFPLDCSRDNTEDHQQDPLQWQPWDINQYHPRVGLQVLQQCRPCPQCTNLVSPHHPVQGPHLWGVWPNPWWVDPMPRKCLHCQGLSPVPRLVCLLLPLVGLPALEWQAFQGRHLARQHLLVGFLVLGCLMCYLVVGACIQVMHHPVLGRINLLLDRWECHDTLWVQEAGDMHATSWFCLIILCMELCVAQHIQHRLVKHSLSSDYYYMLNFLFVDIGSLL